jgi:hypothetical protein
MGKKFADETVEERERAAMKRANALKTQLEQLGFVRIQHFDMGARFILDSGDLSVLLEALSADEDGWKFTGALVAAFQKFRRR